VSVLKALPSDEEISEAGFSDAARYLTMLQTANEDQYNTILRERSTAWGDEPRQTPARCVAHVLSIIYRSMEEKGRSGGRASDVVSLTKAEVLYWFHMHAEQLNLVLER
jgi:hypothetical protein